MTNAAAREQLHGPAVTSTRVNSKMVKNMATERSNGRMVMFTQVNLSKGNDMVGVK